LFWESLVTVAATGWVAPTATPAVCGETLTVIAAAADLVMVMMAAADLVASATEVAVSVTAAGAGGAAGAV
jgi:hypothetical protein